MCNCADYKYPALVAAYCRSFLIFAEGTGGYGECVGYAVARVFVGQFCHRFERGERTVFISAVHRVCAGRKGLACPSAVGRVARIFAVYHVGRYGEHRHCGLAAAVGGVALYLGHKGLYKPYGKPVYPVVVVAVLGIVALYLKVGYNAVLVADGVYISGQAAGLSQSSFIASMTLANTG